MTSETLQLSVNPSDETIDFGPLAVRFLITGDNSTGSVAAFELTVAGGQRLLGFPTPARDAPLARFATAAAFEEEVDMTSETLQLSVNPSDETIDFGPLAVRFLITGDNSTGSVAAFELTVAGGQRLPAPAHSHDHYEETIYGLEGVLTWTVNGRPIEVGPGQALCIARGAIHRFDNLGSQNAKALCVVTPAAIGPQYFREAAEVLRAAAGGPPDRARMAEVMRRHGLTPAPPVAV